MTLCVYVPDASKVLGASIISNSAWCIKKLNIKQMFNNFKRAGPTVNCLVLNTNCLDQIFYRNCSFLSWRISKSFCTLLYNFFSMMILSDTQSLINVDGSGNHFSMWNKPIREYLLLKLTKNKWIRNKQKFQLTTQQWSLFYQLSWLSRQF